MPSALKSFNVEIGSAPLEKFLITDFPLARLDSITALCEIDLSEGIVILPLSPCSSFEQFFA